MKELEPSIAEESSTSFANSTTDDSTTDDSASNEEQNENYERIERDLAKAQKAKAKANARKWGNRQRRRWTYKYIRTQKKWWLVVQHNDCRVVVFVLSPLVKTKQSIQ